jgi:cold shock CspA family protein
MPQATVKSYDSITRTGTLISDDGAISYEVTPESMDSSMFRFLRPGQRITFDWAGLEGDTKKIRNLRIGVA